tara:strand:+ start:5673 stop:5939 length:267 start_codon:yes stop_codon:yes gene_type:complete
MILEISLVLLAILCVASWYGLWNTMKKMEIMEDWISNFMNSAIDVNNKVKEIDYKGYFAEDDETGVIFNQLKETINQLDKLRGEEING